MPIVRINKRENPFVQIDKNAINNPNLSWKAKGLLTYLISKPDNWKILVEDLQKKSNDGRHACRTGLQELEKNGYIIKERERDENGAYSGMVYQVFESPINKHACVANEATNGKPDYGNLKEPFNEPETTNGFPRAGKSTAGKSNTTNNNSTNNDRIKKKPTTKPIDISSEMEQVISTWNSTFDIVVDPSDKNLILAIQNTLEEHSVDEIKQAIKFRSKAKFYEEEAFHLRDNPKSFFEYPQTIKNDMRRYPYKLITYEKKCELEMEGKALEFEKDPDKKDSKDQSMWRMYD